MTDENLEDASSWCLVVSHHTRGQRLLQRRVGPARFERRPTILKHRDLRVGWRGEAPLVPPDILLHLKRAFAWGCSRQLVVGSGQRLFLVPSPHALVGRGLG